MKRRQTDDVFQLSERSFDSPAHGIDLLEKGRSELPLIKICGEDFIAVIGDFDAHDPEIQRIEHSRIGFFVGIRKEIQLSGIADADNRWIGFQIICLLSR